MLTARIAMATQGAQHDVDGGAMAGSASSGSQKQTNFIMSNIYPGPLVLPLPAWGVIVPVADILKYIPSGSL